MLTQKAMKKQNGKRILNLLLDALLPRHCAVCDERLEPNERGICISCLQKLPTTNEDSVWDNETARLFWGKVKIEKAYSLIYYNRQSESQRIFSQMKYRGQTELCSQMGITLAAKAKTLGLFDEIDVIVPVPLHRKRLRERGYNQSERIGQGISMLTGISVNTRVVERNRNTRSQATLGAHERVENVRGAFTADKEEANRYNHILVVDDTITTGSTVLEVMKELQRVAPSCKISVCSIGLVPNLK